MAKGKSNLVPICHQFVFCDQVIRDEATRKFTLVGLFNAIIVSSFPSNHTHMHVFVTLTNFKGESHIELSIKDPNQKELGKLGGEVEFENPSFIAELNFVLNGLPLEMPGVYIFEVILNGKAVASRTLNVMKKEEA